MSPIEPPQAYIPPDNIVPRGDELLHPRRPARPCEPTRLKSRRYSRGALFDLVITNKVCPSEEIDERRLQSFVELVSNNILLSRSPGKNLQPSSPRTARLSTFARFASEMVRKRSSQFQRIIELSGLRA